MFLYHKWNQYEWGDLDTEQEPADELPTTTTQTTSEDQVFLIEDYQNYTWDNWSN